MLDDDLSGTLSTGVRGAGAMIKGAVKGLIVGAALAVVAGAVIMAFAPATLAAFSTGGLMAGASAAGAGLLQGLGGMLATEGGHSAIALMAGLGAVVMGAASILPGVREWPERAKQIASLPSRTLQYGKEFAQAAAPNVTVNLTQEPEPYRYQPPENATEWQARINKERMEREIVANGASSNNYRSVQ